MKAVLPILICVAIIVAFGSAPLTLAVWRLVIPWRKRYKQDGSRIETDRAITVQVGPFKFSDKPEEKGQIILGILFVIGLSWAAAGIGWWIDHTVTTHLARVQGYVGLIAGWLIVCGLVLFASWEA